METPSCTHQTLPHASTDCTKAVLALGLNRLQASPQDPTEGGSCTLLCAFLLPNPQANLKHLPASLGHTDFRLNLKKVYFCWFCIQNKNTNNEADSFTSQAHCLESLFKRKSIHFNFYTHASHVNRTSGELMACLLKRPITSASFVLHRSKSKHAAPMCVTPVKAKSKRD